MKLKKVLLINGHPDKESFNFGLAEAYKQGAENSNAVIDVINIRDLDFDPNLQFGYRKKIELEPDLLNSIDKIKEADHIVWLFPMWWYGYPAIMKGFIDRSFLPGITFDYVPGKALPKKLLKGKTGRIIITADTPKWYNSLFMKNPVINQFKRGTLQFCGINPVRITYIAPVKGTTEEFRNRWLTKIKKLGKENK
ncbi:NAD(P)H-dependent oxidoreductase [Aquimarina sp. RZ0]|uniref:NAD(P)H-dependent oxidoreductase n=1 Tax=Aquimarina sp. RZ0 TaxID=2607730 RepID=UPI0011F1FED9|nr:NAD(P)H-dependent oxidoreductase [Aquimarina sp. RZ0]KAA1247158.1 NAD(P)H-dependent oxidoreductase [Aquimarina sp. RZ0]